MRILWCFVLLSGIAFSRTEFWAPLAPPRAHYSANVKYDAGFSRLEGTETIHFRNDSGRPIGRIALRWFGDSLAVTANGTALPHTPAGANVTLFDLPRDLAPGAEITLAVTFGAAWKLDPATASAITSSVVPQVWWGFGTLGDYEVQVNTPDGYVWATSGRYVPEKRAYIANGARTFGAFLGKGYQSAEADAGGVQVRAVFTAAGRPCAELLVKTAVDAIGFYRERFGVYPHRSLSIVPGMDYPAGGYPSASALVVIHGQHRMPEKPEAFWRWITAHEIGHMYWGNYVLAQGPDSLNWLMIGLGLHADREYRHARNITGAGDLETNYVGGVRKGIDTTMDVTDEQESAIDWDFNNIVEHGKSLAMVNALESVVGRETFDVLYRRILRDYAGKQLGWREFQRIAELQSGQDLDWFFESWVRSSGSVFYRVADKSCASVAQGFDCTVRIERKGSARMPVTVAARFEDGTEQRARTERLVDLDELHFQSKAQLKEVAIEPDRAVAMAEEPPTVRTITAKIQSLPWTGAGAAALEIYRQARGLKIEDTGAHVRLFFALYDGRYYNEALETIQALAPAVQGDMKFAALVWEGHLLDLLGRRTEAVAAYQEALKIPGQPSMRSDQYGMTIDKKWVEERLKTPFERK
jgi:tetratricopeptide (TPR) repeat protein